MGNTQDEDELDGDFEFDGGWGGGLQIGLALGIISIDYGITYRAEILRNEIYEESYMYILSHYGGLKIFIFGFYFNVNQYHTEFIDSKYNTSYGFAWEIFFPVIPSNSFNISPYFRHTITFEEDNIKLEGKTFNPHLFEIGVKLKIF